MAQQEFESRLGGNTAAPKLGFVGEARRSRTGSRTQDTHQHRINSRPVRGRCAPEGAACKLRATKDGIEERNTDNACRDRAPALTWRPACCRDAPPEWRRARALEMWGGWTDDGHRHEGSPAPVFDPSKG